MTNVTPFILIKDDGTRPSALDCARCGMPLDEGQNIVFVVERRTVAVDSDVAEIALELAHLMPCSRRKS